MPVRQRQRDDGAGGGDRDQVPDPAHDAPSAGRRRAPAGCCSRRAAASGTRTTSTAPMDASDPRKRLITVTEQASVNGAPANMQYHGGGIGGGAATQPYQNTDGRNYDLLFVGVVHHRLARLQGRRQRHHRAARRVAGRQHLQRQLPLQQHHPQPDHVQRSTPYTKAQRQPAGLGLFVQDKWTIDRLTLNLGLRFDYLKITIPAQHLDPAPLVPNRNLDLPETDLANWKDLTPRVARGLRPVRHRQDGAQDQHQQVRGGAGRAGAVRRRHRAGEPARELRQPGVERPDVSGRGPAAQQLLPGLRPDQRARQRRVRQPVGHQLRQADAEHDGRSPGARRLGSPALQLGVLRQRPARAGAARVGGLRLLPALVRQLRRDRQPGPGADGLHVVRHRRAGGPAPAGRRRQHHQRLRGSQPQHGDAGAQQLLHAGPRLRRPDPAVERLRSDDERPASGPICTCRAV